MARKKTDEKKTNSEKLARQAGRVAAKAERSATDAVERAKALTTYVAGIIGKPIGAAVHAGQETIGQLSSGVSHLLSADGAAAAAGTALDDVRDAIEARVKAVIHELGIPTRDEHESLRKRVAELESAAARTKPARSVATKAAVKPAARPAAKPAVRPAAKGAPRSASKAPASQTSRKPAGAK